MDNIEFLRLIKQKNYKIVSFTSNDFHKLSSGTGAVTSIFSLETGWIKEIVRA